jgi:hypothetical protein
MRWRSELAPVGFCATLAGDEKAGRADGSYSISRSPRSLPVRRPGQRMPAYFYLVACLVSYRSKRSRPSACAVVHATRPQFRSANDTPRHESGSSAGAALAAAAAAGRRHHTPLPGQYRLACPPSMRCYGSAFEAEYRCVVILQRERSDTSGTSTGASGAAGQHTARMVGTLPRSFHWRSTERARAATDRQQAAAGRIGPSTERSLKDPHIRDGRVHLFGVVVVFFVHVEQRYLPVGVKRLNEVRRGAYNSSMVWSNGRIAGQTRTVALVAPSVARPVISVPSLATSGQQEARIGLDRAGRSAPEKNQMCDDDIVTVGRASPFTKAPYPVPSRTARP